MSSLTRDRNDGLSCFFLCFFFHSTPTRWRICWINGESFVHDYSASRACFIGEITSRYVCFHDFFEANWFNMPDPMDNGIRSRAHRVIRHFCPRAETPLGTARPRLFNSDYHFWFMCVGNTTLGSRDTEWATGLERAPLVCVQLKVWLEAPSLNWWLTPKTWLTPRP